MEMRLHSFDVWEDFYFPLSFGRHNASNIPLMQTQLLAYVMQVLAGGLIPAPTSSLQATGGMPLWSNLSKMDLPEFERSIPH